MNKPKTTALLAAALTALLAALPPATLAASAAGSGSISGTLQAPGGGSVAGSQIIACVRVPGGCDDKASRLMAVDATAAQVAYTLRGIPTGSYVMLAWKDMDGDGAVSDGDLLAVYARDAKHLTTVRPPAQNVALRLRVYHGPGGPDAFLH